MSSSSACGQANAFTSAPPRSTHPVTTTHRSAERMETATKRRKDNVSQDNITMPPGRETTPTSVVVVGPAKHWTELSPEILGTRRVLPATSVHRRQCQRTTPPPTENPHDPRRPRAAANPQLAATGRRSPGPEATTPGRGGPADGGARDATTRGERQWPRSRSGTGGSEPTQQP